MPRAIDSVLKQTFSDYEILVVDDGSKDNTRSMVEPYLSKVRYLYQNNQGVSAARNKGIKESSGEYIAFLDSDDYWAPEKLELQTQILDGDIQKKIGIVYSVMPIVNAKGEYLGFKPGGKSGRNFKELLQIWGDLPTSSVMIRRECFTKAGLFDETLTMAEDTEMWLRISQFYELYRENKTLAYYYRHDEQVTKNRFKLYEGTIRTDLKILNSYKGQPLGLIIRRIAVHEYLMAKEYYERKDYAKALGHLCRAQQRYLMLGVLFFNPDDPWFQKVFKLIKPYIFFIICVSKLLWSKVFNVKPVPIGT